MIDIVNNPDLFMPEDIFDPVEESEKGKTATDLFLEATKPFIDLYKQSTPEEQEKLVAEYGEYSMGEFLGKFDQ